MVNHKAWGIDLIDEKDNVVPKAKEVLEFVPEGLRVGHQSTRLIWLTPRTEEKR